MKAWFVSDIHLKNINERNSQTLLRFLHSILSKERPATHLFLVGDIFDLWVGDSDMFQRQFQSLVDALVNVKKMGVEVIYFEGNHDVHVKRFWEGKFGIPVYINHKHFNLGPWNVRVEHGDFINPDDTTYLKWVEFMHRPFMEKIAHIVPGKIWFEAGAYASRRSRKKSVVRRERNLEGLRAKIRTYAEKVYAEDTFDYLVTGHMHLKDDYNFDRKGRKVHSVNLGSWYETPQALLLEESGHSWVEL